MATEPPFNSLIEGDWLTEWCLAAQKMTNYRYAHARRRLGLDGPAAGQPGAVRAAFEDSDRDLSDDAHSVDAGLGLYAE